MRIFVSYSHEDRRWFDKYPLIPWLSKALRKYGVEFWYDPSIIPGEKFQERIETEISKADITILLVSQDFIDSEFIKTVEIPAIEERAKTSKLTVIPILVGYCNWESIPLLGERKMIPGGPTPLIEYVGNEAKWDRVRHEILQSIEKHIERKQSVESVLIKPETTVQGKTFTAYDQSLRLMRKKKITGIFIVSVLGFLALTAIYFGIKSIFNLPNKSKPLTTQETLKMKFIGKNQQGYEEFLWLKDSSIIIKIPAGTFTMGSNEGDADEKPVHQVYLDEYYIDKYEVTNQQFEKFIRETSYRTDAEKEDSGFVHKTNSTGWIVSKGVNWRSYYSEETKKYPVVLVSWNDAKAFSEWVGKKLPTEAEWEKAARGTDARNYPWGNGNPDGSNCNFADVNTEFSWRDKNVDDKHKKTAPVGYYSAGISPFGCLDMAGNVWEWCQDWYLGDYYKMSPNNNPQGPMSGDFRILRGGAWHNTAKRLRSTSRANNNPMNRSDDVGFRCAIIIQE